MVDEGIDIVFGKERELTKTELINLNSKKGKSIPVEYFRKNLFNATTRESRELSRKKIIYDDGKTLIKVNRSLHQRHRDLLSILFTDNIKVSEPLKDGSYSIHTSLYDLSKKMGYNPLQGINKVTKFLEDLHQTLMIVDIKGVGEIKHTLLGDGYYDKYKTKEFKVDIPSLTAKYHILSFAVEIPKEINRKIIAIPNKYAKTKALVSYILSNKALKNGVSFSNTCDKLDINISARKSEFRRELKENSELLSEFNIYFNEETDIIKYEQLCNIKFHRAVKAQEIIDFMDTQIDPKEEELKELKSFFIGKYLKQPAKMGEGFVYYEILDLLREEDEFCFEIQYESSPSGRLKSKYHTKERMYSFYEDGWITNTEKYV